MLTVVKTSDMDTSIEVITSVSVVVAISVILLKISDVTWNQLVRYQLSVVAL